MGKLENLRNTTWLNSQPSIVPVAAAYEASHTANHFYMVLWWKNEPAGFSRFEFTGVISGGYEIKITDERGEYIKALESDEWVLIFAQ
ncbi:MAG: hypothetical protein H0X30_15955 [Anaerolineae bacterium]|nr:hypothetical protein [Anaerolineae bacterium]